MEKSASAGEQKCFGSRRCQGGLEFASCCVSKDVALGGDWEFLERDIVILVGFDVFKHHRNATGKKDLKGCIEDIPVWE